jgi:hypothetical protein
MADKRITPEQVEGLIANMELRGDWGDAELIKSLRDRLLQLEAYNQAYRHALSSGVTINMIGKKRWFRNN